ncbi:MAG: hypothetical protein IE909_17480 [Campylobacterales bacterium]|nr:hypothetical protein [Campylobacterales bacterium]
MGLSPTLGRQVAYARGRENGFDFFKRLLKSFELIFLGLATLFIVGIFFASDWIAQSWIKAESLDPAVIVYCIVLMGIMIGLRWFAGLYRSGINGLEDQVWLNAANIVLISLKFIGFIEVLVFTGRFYRKLSATEKSPSLVAFDCPLCQNFLKCLGCKTSSSLEG